MKGGLLIVGIVVIVALVFSGQLMGSRNQLVTEKNDIDARWAQVENSMKRRADLIPNLVETVKGYAKQEQTVIGEVANARAALLGARTKDDAINANNQLSGALGRLLVLTENYPQLKSNENFLRLQDELAGTENRIAVDRRDYNEAIKKYNTDVQLFPRNIAAAIFGFHPDNAYFKITEEEKKVPQVKF
ncbi:MAG: LemA family protein [Acidobacteriaceae bacterium]|nr:LemA family protein [Acidobacteriaceae bacterium]MBV9037090.1 LemA family protein [Acidobacteriaceae bacterium]MBV9224888.1 LemA family protein [Acidobacteriaceae bacterium]MBV9306585.1 LemA family protein [Acidobacteriaceae bacterium]MBV9675799.1 LemA family protein [Acidobacteriaceae bacterium]